MRSVLIGLGILLAVVIGACGEPVDRQSVVATAIAAQTEAGQLAEDTAEALAELERAWELVATGPQITAQMIIGTADDLERKGFPERAERMRAEARANFDTHPFTLDAKAATKRFHELGDLYTEADKAAVTALEAVRDADAWTLYEETRAKE